MKAKINRNDPNTPFLSNKVTGDLKVETPDGCNYSDDMSPYTDNPQPPLRTYGARSGMGKRTTVV